MHYKDIKHLVKKYTDKGFVENGLRFDITANDDTLMIRDKDSNICFWIDTNDEVEIMQDKILVVNGITAFNLENLNVNVKS